MVIFNFLTFSLKHFTELFQQSSLVESNHMARLTKLSLCIIMEIAITTGFIFHFDFDIFSELSLALNKEGL